MSQACHPTAATADRSDGGCKNRDAGLPFPMSRPLSECEWKPFDLIRKRSGPHNLTRSGYDEDKCRSVLVRFCAHVPRNFQYKDGIQQVFLILREHLGDENLDLAGGVLYELIEVDCEHTDDPGAAFQRWRHDHMHRYADLELPHIPHMTTITSSIIPTERLSRWRSDHSDRYRFVLSDSAPLARRSSTEASCIRNKKAWLIDHTLFVSTRSEGTRPMRSPNPKQFHEMQWDPYYGATGRLIEERELPTTYLDQKSQSTPSSTPDNFPETNSRSRRLRHLLSGISIIEKLTCKLVKPKKTGQVDNCRRSWIPNPLILNSSPSLREKRSRQDIIAIPLPEDCQINAIFARKFRIVENNEALAPHLPLIQMPTAEIKATESIVRAATAGLLHETSPWLFRGPFTPQLGFDGGLDYQWSPQDPDMTIRRFDVESPAEERRDQGDGLDCQVGERQLEGPAGSTKTQQSPSRRGGVVFDVKSGTGTELEWYSSSYYSVSDESNSCMIRDIPAAVIGYSPPLFVPNHTTETVVETPTATRTQVQYRSEPPRQGELLFENIEFTYHAEPGSLSTPATNRQTAVIERPKQEGLAFDPNSKRGDTQRMRGPLEARSQPGVPRGIGHPDSTERALGDSRGNTPFRVLSNQQDGRHGRLGTCSSRQVSHRVTGELLQPLRYNASGGRKGDQSRK